MARARNIKPGFFTNDLLADLPMATRLLFIGLWTLADREGRLEDRPKKIKMEIFPADDVDVDEALSTLVSSAFIQRYRVNGVGYIQVVNFTKHQRPHSNESASTIPPPTQPGDETPRNAPESPDETSTAHQGEQDGAPRLAALRPDTGYLDTDTGYRIPDGGEPSRTRATEPPPADPEPPKKARATKAERATPAPQALELTDALLAYGAGKGLTEQQIRDETEQFLDWCRARGQTYVDWQAAWRKWIAKSVTFRASPAVPPPRLARVPVETFNGDPVLDRHGNPTPAYFARELAQRKAAKELA